MMIPNHVYCNQDSIIDKVVLEWIYTYGDIAHRTLARQI